jgi:DeoR family glycerol-3-phosphate regulon repressor
LLDFSPEESSITRSIIENSETRILVADHSKINRYAPVVTGTLSDIDILIMDSLSEPYKQACKDFESEIIEVGSSPESVSC